MKENGGGESAEEWGVKSYSKLRNYFLCVITFFQLRPVQDIFFVVLSNAINDFNDIIHCELPAC